MISLPLVIPHGTCQASRPCTGTPCFQIQLEAPASPQPAHRDAAACPSHLGEVVCGLAAWAQEQGLEGGYVTVLAVGPSPVSCPPAAPSATACGFAFTSIPLYRAPEGGGQ